MNHMGGHAVESDSSGQGLLGHTYEHGNELEGITNCTEFHHYLQNNHRVNSNSPPHS